MGRRSLAGDVSMADARMWLTDSEILSGANQTPGPSADENAPNKSVTNILVDILHELRGLRGQIVELVEHVRRTRND